MSVQAFLEQYLWILFTTGIAICIVVAAGILARRRAAGFSVPRPATVPLVRWGETALWGVGIALLLLSYRGQYDDYVHNPNTVPVLLAEVARRTTWLALAGALVVLAAVFRRPRVAGILLALLISAALNPTQPVYQWPVVEAAVLNSPMPFTFATPPDLPPVTVTANDVPLGTTPVVTTWEDLKARTPEWKIKPEFHRQSDRGTLVWCPLSVHATGMRTGAPPERDEKHFFLRYQLAARPLYLYDSNSFTWGGFVRTNFSGASGQMNNGMRTNGQIFPFQMDPLLTLPTWGDDVQFLMHRARLMDYTVDDVWCTAFESYGGLAATALAGLMSNDPELQRVSEALAVRSFPQSVEPVDEVEAWRRLLAIVDDAGRRGEFHFSAHEGIAVRRLAARISDQALAERTAAELSCVAFERGRSIETHSSRPGRVTLIRITPRDGNLDPRWLRPRVLEQLAIERDAALDAVATEPDNPIEILVTPALMRQHRVGDGAARQIGGRSYEQALVRHDWHRQPPDQSKFDDVEYIFGAHVNRWLLRLGELDTRFGRQFRISHQHDFLTLARELWMHDISSSSVPDSLDFLFREHRADLPVADGKHHTLAENFWEDFTGHRPRLADAREQLTMRWTYLARMSPDSRPQQFVKALRELQPDWIDSTATNFLKLMPAGMARETLIALLDEIDRQSHSPEFKPPVSGFPNLRATLIEPALAIEHADMASVVIAELNRSDSDFKLPNLANAVREGRVSLAILEKLASSDRADIRKTVAECGLYRTSPAERRVIDQLSRDPEESVRAAARRILDQWSEWKSRSLPSRVVPTANP